MAVPDICSDKHVVQRSTFCTSGKATASGVPGVSAAGGAAE